MTPDDPCGACGWPGPGHHPACQRHLDPRAATRRWRLGVLWLLYGWAAVCALLYLWAGTAWWSFVCCAVGPCVTYYGATLLAVGATARGLGVSLVGWAMVAAPTVVLLL